jgi:hypothetical protein
MIPDQRSIVTGLEALDIGSPAKLGRLVERDRQRQLEEIDEFMAAHDRAMCAERQSQLQRLAAILHLQAQSEGAGCPLWTSADEEDLLTNIYAGDVEIEATARLLAEPRDEFLPLRAAWPKPNEDFAKCLQIIQAVVNIVGQKAFQAMQAGVIRDWWPASEHYHVRRQPTTGPA